MKSKKATIGSVLAYFYVVILKKPGDGLSVGFLPNTDSFCLI
jgi:hypothetical protein